MSVGTLVVGVVACHLGAHGGGCSVPSYGTGWGEGSGKGDLSAVVVVRVVELQWIGGGAVVEWRWWSSGGGWSIVGGGWWHG